MTHSAAGMFASAQAMVALRAAARQAPAAPVPPQVVRWLARLRLLHDVPFQYLVVDSALLPSPESIRFFFVDRNWTDAACDGALSVAAGPKERAQLRTRHAELRDTVDMQERNTWHTRIRPDETLTGPPDTPLTGFLLRSRLVSGWPGIRVRATRPAIGDPSTQVPVHLCRLERLAPAVLLALFDGVPSVVTLEESLQGIQFGFDPDGGGYAVPGRDGAPQVGPVPFRAGSPGVVDAIDLARTLGAPGDPVGAAATARRLMQFPFVQEFHGVPDPGTAVFQPSITLADLNRAFEDQP